MTEEEKFTVNEVAEKLKKSRRTIYRWIEEGFLKNLIKVKDGYLIPKSELDRIQTIVNPTNPADS
jgi:excisionase family DNA binding protein